MTDIVELAARCKGSDLLPKVLVGGMNAETLILRMADEITRLRAELAAAREQVAGAYLAAASTIAANEEAFSTKTNKRFLQARSFGNLVGTAYAPAIHALTPADATAALEARDERVRAEERAKVIAEALALKPKHITLGGKTYSAVPYSAVLREDIDALHTEASREVK